MAEGMEGPWAAIIRLERFVLSALGNMYLQLEIFEQGRKRRCLGRTQNARERQRGNQMGERQGDRRDLVKESQSQSSGESERETRERAGARQKDTGLETDATRDGN